MAHSDLMLAPSSNGRGGSQARWLRPLSAAGLGAVAGALVVAAAGRRKASHTRSPAVMDGTPERRLYSGRDVSQALSVADLRAIAHRRLPRFALEYLEGGADDEATLARNRAALARYYFTHRSFVDVAHRDISTTLFGKKMTMPVAIAPTGLNELFWPHADLRLAEAAGACGIAFAQSTMSNDPMEQVGKVPGLRHWWQLYVFGPQVVQDTLIERARRAGCEALIVTDDAQIFGNRVWSRRNNSGPKDLSWSAKLDAALHPRWFASSLLTHGMPVFRNVIDFVPRDRRAFFDSAFWIRQQMDRSLSWDRVKRIRDRWPGTLILKGILDAGDVATAAGIGADAVALSNHGGRQLDWAVSPLDILPEARRIIGDRMTLLVDGGIRRGSDVLKALSLGADAVMIGRAALYGVAAGGRAGVERALDILREEIDRDLGLLGLSSLSDMQQLSSRCTEPPAPR